MSELVDKKKKPADDSDSDSEDEQNQKAGADETGEAEPEEDTTLANPDVVTKYQEAAKIAQAALIEISARCVPGARIVDICKFGDDLIEERTAGIYNKKNKQGKKVAKGVAFPVCVSVNDVICHCSPLLSDGDSFPVLEVNDLVKIDMGVHIGGFIALTAHTVLVGVDLTDKAAAQEIVSGPRAHVINAAYTAAEVASRLIKDGNTNTMVTAAVRQIAEAYGVDTISGTVMHQLKQFVIDGKKQVALKDESDQQRVEACTFETGEVYAIDIAMSTGDGKCRESGSRTTVYRRKVEQKYSLKNKASRQFFNDINKRYPTMPFSLRSLPDEKASKLGVRECVTHDLLAAYPMLSERKESIVAHIKFTVLLLPTGTLQITGLPPLTFKAMCTLGLASDEGVPVLGGNIGSILANQLTVDKNVTLPENITEVLMQVKPENKKKAKKAAAAKKKAEETAAAAAATVAGAAAQKA